jgi:hypothetical protein
MSVFGFNECWVIAGWTAFVFHLFCRPSLRSSGWYDRGSFADKPPRWLLSVVWTLVYGLLTATIVILTRIVVANTWQMYFGVVVFMLHIVFNHCWGYLFWIWDAPILSFNVIVALVLPTAVALYLPFVYDTPDLYYIPVVFLTGIVIWMLYISYLNKKWADAESKSMIDVQKM